MSISFENWDRLREWSGHTTIADDAGPATERSRKAIAGQLMNDPYFKRYIVTHPNGQLVSTPAACIGEQRFMTLAMLSAPQLYGDMDEQSSDIVATAINGQRYTHEMSVSGIGLSILMAQPFLWLDSITNLAASGDLPRHIISRTVLPHPLMYWCYESGRVSPELPQFITDAVLVRDVGTGIEFTGIGSRGDNAPRGHFISGGMIPYGHRYPDDFPNSEQVRPVLAMLSFLNSPYVDSHAIRPTRAERREAERSAPRPGVCEEVHVIRLRAEVEHVSATYERAGDGTGKEWSHRWMVRAHHRAQWYPSLGEHKVIWIPAHIKGPADKELRLPVYVVGR